MRELKFRVWDKLAERFILPDKGFQGHYILDLNGCFHDLGNGSGGDEYVVQQYTGLKDKNEKEIYEGDILFFQQQDGVWSNQLNKHIEVKYPFVCGNAHLGEIIGNIFENSELLNQ